MACAKPVNFNEGSPDPSKTARLRGQVLTHHCSPNDVDNDLTKSLPATLGRSSLLGSHGSLPLSPLANGRPRLTTQPSMITVSNDSFRSPSVLDDISTNLLRRYPRFSTATTSMDTGRPNFSADELTSTELSDDENGIINDDPRPSAPSARMLMKYKLARDVRALWNSQTTRIRYAKQRVKRLSRGEIGQSSRDDCATAPDQIHAILPATDDDQATNVSECPMPRQNISSVSTDEIQSTKPSAPMYTRKLVEVFQKQQVDSEDKSVAFVDKSMLRQTQAAPTAPVESQRAIFRNVPPLETNEDDVATDQYAGVAFQKMKIQTQNMTDFGATTSSTVDLIVPQLERVSLLSSRRASASNIRRNMQPSSRPGTMRERRSFSGRTSRKQTETLFTDTPHNQGTSFVFPTKPLEEHHCDLGGSRPTSHAGSMFSVQTAFRATAEEVGSQVKFGKAVPPGHKQIPAYTIRRIERDNWVGLNGLGLPALPDSPIAFNEQLHGYRENMVRRQGKEVISRASKWSTKVQPNGDELKEQEGLMEDTTDEDRSDRFAVRSCHRIARALSNRVGSSRSLPGRFGSRRLGHRAKDAA